MLAMNKFKMAIVAALVFGVAFQGQAQGFNSWTAGDGDFYDGSNWDVGSVPGADDIAIINNGSTATIAADAGDRELASLELGENEGSDDSGHVIMNGGFLRIGGFQGDPKVHIGEGTVQSTFIMNGGTIFFDGPDEPSMAGSSSAGGINNSDWEVGEHGVGRFEMHGDAVFRAGDDLKIAENAAGSASCLIDGNARLSVGSGISLTNGGENEQVMVIGGNAIVDSGNSLGAGHPDGYTDEGYLTLSIGGGKANFTVQENGVFNFRVLSSRQGETLFTIKDQGQVHIFDVLTGKGFIDDATPADRPEVPGGSRSSLSSGGDTDSTLMIQDSGQMTVNSIAGLGISGPRGGTDDGGKALMIVRDSGSFRVEQDFALATGTKAETSDGTLEVRGPDATVSIGGNLNMAVDPDGLVPTTDLVDGDGDPVPAKSTLHVVITSSTQSTVQVDGIARIGQGILKVSLDGMTPVGGESFTLIQGGEIDGEFREVDYSAAALSDGLSWEIEYTTEAVLLTVAGGGVVDPGAPVAGGLELSSELPATVAGGRVVNDTIVFDTGEDNLDNWEPFSSVVGNSVFVVEANTFADDGLFANQSYAVAFQPVSGGAPVTSAGFYGDDGTPYTGAINGSRQNGNPGRIAADRRPGATTYVVGGEASPHLFDPFQSDGRWNLGFDRLTDGRYAAVQSFSLDPSTLASTSLSPALDAINGRVTSGEASGSQIGRFGGDITVLDNGNIVVVADDRSQILESTNSSTAVILAPDGSVVKDSWVIDPRDIWSNVTSYQNGFAVRVHEIIYFHDNDGNLSGQVDIVNDLPSALVEPGAVSFDTGRGDSTRISGHINSPFVYLAGAMGILDSEGFPVEDENFQPVEVVRVAAFDSTKSGAASFVGSAVVNELASDLSGDEDKSFLPGLGRVNLASDALDRIAVAYEGTLRDEFGDSIGLAQTFVRVLSFDGQSGDFAKLTPSFFAYVNQNDIDIRTFRPTVAMTTEAILVAGKGEINSGNNPDQGPDTPQQATFYTVFAHPAPQADPTPGLVGTGSNLAISVTGAQVNITWDGAAVLKSSSDVSGPYSPVTGATSPYQTTADQSAAFYVIE